MSRNYSKNVYPQIKDEFIEVSQLLQVEQAISILIILYLFKSFLSAMEFIIIIIINNIVKDRLKIDYV